MSNLSKRPLPEPPYKTPLVDENYLLSPAWQRWINEIYVRMGGKAALSNIQLESITDDLDARVTALE